VLGVDGGVQVAAGFLAEQDLGLLERADVVEVAR
jgi:hypothetical protein